MQIHAVIQEQTQLYFSMFSADTLSPLVLIQNSSDNPRDLNKMVMDFFIAKGGNGVSSKLKLCDFPSEENSLKCLLLVDLFIYLFI